MYSTYLRTSYVQDIHTVDDGIESHLWVELATKEWDVFIGTMFPYGLSIESFLHMY